MTKTSTAEKIVVAAGKVLDREGAPAITMRRVAKSVGITPMALYRHFEDRDGLLNTLADRGFEVLAERAGGTPMPADAEQQLMKILAVFLDFALQKPRLFELMFLERREGARQFPEDFREGKSPTAKFVVAALETGMNEGSFRRDDVWEITFETGALLQGLVMLYLGGRMRTSVEEFRALCHRALRRHVDGIRR